jgi:uncharacterized protein
MRNGATETSGALTESVVARAAIGLVALHVADDNFLQPQPGTSAIDHLVSGLVPLVLLALAAWGYPRLRAGLRATIALVIGAFGVVAGVEAVYYTTKGGPSGDDFTGFLAIPAGIVLLVVGLVTLWRSRRRDNAPARRYGRRALLALGAVAVVYVLIAPLYTAYVFTHVARGFVPEVELGVAYEDVSFRTGDGWSLWAGTYRLATAPPSSRFRAGKARSGKRECSRATATARCSSTGAARARATAIRTSSVGAVSEI